VCSAHRSLEGCLLPVAVQCLPIIAEAGEHGESRLVCHEGPNGNHVSGLLAAIGTDVEPIGSSGRNGSISAALVAVHDKLGALRYGLLAQVADPISVARRFARDADQTVPLSAIEGQDR